MTSAFLPDQTAPAALELEACASLLTVVTSQSRPEAMRHNLQAFTASGGQLAWVIYLSDSATLDLDALEALLTEADPGQEIVVIPASETAHSLPEIFAACSGYLDLDCYQTLPPAFEQARAMGLPILCHPQQSAAADFCLNPLDLSLQTGSSLLETLLRLHRGSPQAGKILHRLSQAGKEPAWVKTGLNWLQQHQAELELATISFWGRSGSVLLNSLLDGHPDIITVGAGNFASMSFFNQLWLLLESRQITGFANLIEAFCNTYRKENLSEGNREFWIFTTADPAYEAAFKHYAQSVLQTLSMGLNAAQLQQQARRVFFIAVQFAYYLSKGIDIQGRRLIVFQQHQISDLHQLGALTQDFPRLRMLGMIRHPIRGYYSMLAQVRSTHARSWEGMVHSGDYLTYWRQQLIGWRLAESLVGSPVYAISLEALHQDPEATTRALAAHLGIDWSPALLESSIDGKQQVQVSSGVHGTITARQAVFDPERVNYSQWKERLSDWDCFVLEGLLHEVMESYLKQPIPLFQKSLCLLFQFMPLRLEWQALQAALRSRSETDFKLVLLGMAERWYYTLLFLCGYVYLGRPAQYRATIPQVLGMSREA